MFFQKATTEISFPYQNIYSTTEFLTSCELLHRWFFFTSSSYFRFTKNHFFLLNSARKCKSIETLVKNVKLWRFFTKKHFLKKCEKKFCYQNQEEFLICIISFSPDFCSDEKKKNICVEMYKKTQVKNDFFAIGPEKHNIHSKFFLARVAKFIALLKTKYLRRITKTFLPRIETIMKT